MQNQLRGTQGWKICRRPELQSGRSQRSPNPSRTHVPRAAPEVAQPGTRFEKATFQQPHAFWENQSSGHLCDELLVIRLHASFHPSLSMACQEASTGLHHRAKQASNSLVPSDIFEGRWTGRAAAASATGARPD